MSRCPDCGQYVARCRSCGEFGHDCVRRCPYCGVVIRGGQLVCRKHADLPNLDPMLTRPKVNPKPIGVQPFVKG